MSSKTFKQVRATLALASLLFASGAAFAQTAVDGAVEGTVADATGAVIAAVQVTAHNLGTNADQTALTDGSGNYRLTRLQPGEYTVTMSIAGFSPFTAQHVVVEVGRATDVDAKLVAGGAAQDVTVSSDASIINTDSADFSTNFNQTSLESLPINGRHWTSFALLSPGVTLGNSAFGQVTFRGTSNLQNNFLVDGSDDNQAFQSVERGYTRVGYSTTQEAIQEFQVLTSNYSAQYGRAVGGGVNAVTRSGTNQFHGDAFWYYRDNDFGAINPFSTLAVISPTTGLPVTTYIKPKDKRHQYGGSFAGPLIHDKLFFLYAFDQQKRNFPIVAVPTPQFLDANNSAVNNCSVAGSTAKVSATQCALNRGVTQDQINSALAYINGQSGVAPRQGDQILNFAKLDYKLNEKNNISAIYDRMRWDSLNGTQTNPIIRRGLTSIGSDFVKVDSYIGKINTFVTPTINNELRVEYAKGEEDETGNTPLANEPTTTSGGLPPGVSITTNSGFNMGTPYYVPRSHYPNETEAEIGDTVLWVKGNHSITAGFNYRWVQDDILAVNYLHGLFTYARLADWFTDYARTLGSTAGCDAAKDSSPGSTLPCYTNLQQAFGRPQFVYHTHEYAGFAQDDWKLTPTLTLNIGVRYDFEQMPAAKIPNQNQPATAKLPSDKNNIAPRIGFAWDVFHTGKTVMHGGYGLYYGRILNGTIYSALSTTGSPSAQFQLNTSATSASPAIYPNIVPNGPNVKAPTVSNIVAFAPNFQAPYGEQMDLSLQQDLGWNTVLGIAYLGTMGRELPNFIDQNVAPATVTPKTYTFTGGPFSGRTWTVPLYTQRVATTSANALTYVTSNTNTSYNALSVVVDHRMSRGVQFQASYTWSKALDYDMNQTSSNDTNDPVDPFSVKGDYGLSANDIPHRFVGDIVFQPHADLSNRYFSMLANGWSIDPVFTVQSGVPYNYGLSGGTALAGGSTSFNGSGGGNYINFWAYRNLAGNQGLPGIRRNSKRQTTIEDVDLRVSRSFAVKEKYHLKLLGESFNLMNRQNYTAFNTTAYTLSGNAATYQSTFGTPSAAGNTIYRERQIQFSARFEF
jgi:hypothetical protein